MLRRAEMEECFKSGPAAGEVPRRIGPDAAVDDLRRLMGLSGGGKLAPTNVVGLPAEPAARSCFPTMRRGHAAGSRASGRSGEV